MIRNIPRALRAVIYVQALIICLQQVEGTNETKLALDDMSIFWGDSRYPERAYQSIVDCLGKWDEPVLESHDVAWRTFYEMYTSLEAAQDASTRWRESDSFLESRQKKKGLYGGNFNSFGAVEVSERCNFVSNVAYYNAALRICKYGDRWHSNSSYQSALMKSIGFQSIASGYFHGSFSRLGFVMDVENAGLPLFLAYQMAIQSVGDVDDPNFNATIFRTGSNIKPLEDITPFWKPIDEMTFLPLKEDLSFLEWSQYINDLDVPDAEESALLFCSWFCIATLPYSLCECLMADVLAPAFINNQTKIDFVKNEYFPQAKIAADSLDLPLPAWIGFPLLGKGLGAALSILWAYLFQENRLKTPGLEGMYFNVTALGATKTPSVDFLINILTGFGNPTKYTYNSEEAYPGASFCNRDSPHALWHQESADALPEIAFAADKLYRVLQDRKERKQQGNWFGFSIFNSFQNIRGGGHGGED
ncbi:expressed unknown protein [Seminavis robusta]|uniref:Secreted protein n=1 Tax=Seminavis robusta TaxID=568900 RepID=A0A9N8DKZ0_9STRA|nr:expressed unknown protein [Seminavis robusta]|eukprot:Sro216_g089180.1 n/a (475) ;mRNA; f:577-2001